MSKTILPSQTGAAGKFLKSDGTDATFETIEQSDVSGLGTSLDSKADLTYVDAQLADKVAQAEELGEEHTILELPNGVTDEFYESDGVWNKYKRVDQTTLTNTNIASYVKRTGYDEIYFQAPSDAIIGTSSVDLGVNLVGYEQISFSQMGIESIGKYYYDNNQTRVRLVVEPDTYNNTEDAQASFTDILTLIYQLAQPVEIPLPNPMTPNTRELIRQAQKIDEIIAAIEAL